MTSAPKSARVCVQAGPATTRVKSTTSRPSRAVGAPSVRGKRSGNGNLAVMGDGFLLASFVPRQLYGLLQRDHKGLRFRATPWICRIAPGTTLPHFPAQVLAERS